MKLVRYRVMNFRSVKDSGWINCDDVTTLVGPLTPTIAPYKKQKEDSFSESSKCHYFLIL